MGGFIIIAFAPIPLMGMSVLNSMPVLNNVTILDFWLATSDVYRI